MSESLLCYFVTSLAREGVAPSNVRTYLAAVRHAQVVRGHSGPRELSSLPRLRLVQNGAGLPPDQASPNNHPGDPAPDAPTSHPSASDGQLSGDDAVGSRDGLLFWFLSRRRNHRPPLIGLRRKGAPLLGRRGTAPGAIFCGEGGASTRFVVLVRAALTRAGVLWA